MQYRDNNGGTIARRHRLYAARAQSNTTHGISGGEVGQLLFRCPKTNQEFDSGFQFTVDDFKRVPSPATMKYDVRIVARFTNSGSSTVVLAKGTDF
jgi:hypothetical protein